MQGVVLAAGEGTRLRPRTESKPKPMVEVAGRPILSHVLDSLLALDVEELVVVEGYRGDVIRDHYGDSYDGVPITYAHQEPREGMAHALLQAEPHVDGEFVLMDGDGVVDAGLRRLVERQRDPETDATILVEAVSAEDARSKAIVKRDDAGQLVRIEKEPADPPDPSYVAASVHAFAPGVFDACRRVERSPRGEFELSDAIDRLARQGTVYAVECDGWLRNVNTDADLRAAREHLGE
jgi:glucose-1-phosphate thymidylyltransferase